MGHQPEEIRAANDLHLYEKPFAGLVSRLAQLCRIFPQTKHLLAPAFQALSECWLAVIAAVEPEKAVSIVDSCPTILAKGARSGHAKVAAELCEKSYNSSRKEWYYGVKLHTFVARHAGCLPTPQALLVSGAAIHDLTAAKQIVQDSQPLSPGQFYADKAYINAAWAETLKQEYSIQILTPRKKVRMIPFFLVTHFLPLLVLSASQSNAFLIGLTVLPIFRLHPLSVP